MVDALSRYPPPLTSSNTSAKESTQHPHTGFDINSFIVLKHSSLPTTPITSIDLSHKSTCNEQKLISPLIMTPNFALDTILTLGAKSSYLLPKVCQIS